MEPIDSKKSEAVGWHLIARGGDMTARVHAGMRLGVLVSGDLSFEAPDAVVELNLVGEALNLNAVADDYELELEAGERIRTLRVGAQTHISLDFLGHTLDIDNDFAVASPGDALAVYVVRRGEPRKALGPLSAGAHQEDILVGERSTVAPLKAVPVDYLQRAHADVAAEKRQTTAKGSGVRRAVLALVASVLVVAGLVVTALYVASKSVEQAMTPAAASELRADGKTVDEPTADTAAAVDSQTVAPVSSAVDLAGPVAAGISQDMLAKFSALLQADPLPDKATIDFAVESLRSLMVAYPSDPRIPAALTSLNERLVREARQSYDEGDAFRAGRLIEQATTLGLAGAAVTETLAYFASRPPGAAAAEAMLIEALAREEAQEEAQEEVPTLPEPKALIEPPASAVVETAGAEEAGGLDSLVESATGLALGALAVELIVEDAGPGRADLGTDPVLEALGPALPLGTESNGVDSRVQQTLDNYIAGSLVTSGSSYSANELPAGFAADESGGGPESEKLPAPAPSGPRFQPYSELQAVRQSPLVYPSRALEGAEGSIDVEFTVTPAGRVIDVNVSGDAPGIFLREAVRTIRTWRFAPVQVNGEAVPVRTALRVTYRS